MLQPTLCPLTTPPHPFTLDRPFPSYLSTIPHRPPARLPVRPLAYPSARSPTRPPAPDRRPHPTPPPLVRLLSPNPQKWSSVVRPVIAVSTLFHFFVCKRAYVYTKPIIKAIIKRFWYTASKTRYTDAIISGVAAHISCRSVVVVLFVATSFASFRRQGNLNEI